SGKRLLHATLAARCYSKKYVAEIKKARQVKTAGPRKDRDEEKETELLGQYSEIPNKRATLFRAAPGGPEALALKIVGQRIRRHGVSRLGERLVPDLFVAAEM